MRPPKGFTLIELMLVVAIIGLLAAIAIPKMANMIDKAREAANKGGLGSLRGALSIYYADMEGAYPKYNLPFSADLGALVLQGKYIDLTSIRFRVMSYLPDVPFSHGGAGNSISAWQFYQPLGGGQARSLGGTPNEVSYSYDSIFPQYGSWQANAFTNPSFAEFRVSCVHNDLGGRIWSLY